MLNKKIYVLFLLLVISIGIVSSVSANELTDDVDVDDELGINEDVIEEKLDEYGSEQLSEVSGNDAEQTLGAADEQPMSNDEKSFLDLQILINNAFEGGIIDLRDDYCWDSSYTGSGIFIDKDLTVNGNGHTIDGAENLRIFLISGENVVLNNINFVNGYGDSTNNGYGGAISIYGDNKITTINNCNFTNNYATGSGGAIATKGKLNINNCYFGSNHADEDGGAIYAFCPLGYDYSVKISGSNFYDNGADQYGGAIYLNAVTSEGYVPLEAMKSYITNSNFDLNYALYGGAIFNSHYLDIKSVDFANNEAEYGGGAIYMAAGALYTNDGESSKYIAYPFGLEIHGTSSFVNNGAYYYYGGAIRVSSNSQYASYGVRGILKVYDNVLFEANWAPTGGALSLVESDSVVQNAVFRNNDADEASAMEGGIAIDCIFEGNTGSATSGVEVIYRKATTLSVKQSGSAYNAKTITVTSNAANANIVVKFSNGKSVTLKTNSKGVATYKVPYNPGTYSATLSFAGNNYYKPTTATAKVSITKATPKITASKKTFKLKVKTKKYAITLKSNVGKAIKGAKITLKINGKTYKAKTNAKGKATFKINKLKKQGTFKATIKYSGDSCYKTVSKSVKITVKK